MNADRLIALYDRIADAPDAVARLRRFILDLAVRGKLVPQDPNDEPASELLKRIEKEKARLVKAGELRKPRDLDNGSAFEAPFPIPATWRWVRLDAIGAIVGGGTPPATDADNFTNPGQGIPWLTPADLGGYSELYILRGARDLSAKGLRISSATLMPKGTVLFTSRAPIGYVAIAANLISTNQGFKSIVPYFADCSRFISTAMKAFATEIDAQAPGTTFKEVSGKIVAAVPFPLPPLAEQHRIVAKVDELMVLCDRLEATRAGREATRDKLTTASLTRLNASDSETFHDDVRFALDALPALTTRPDQIKQLRQTILNLAVRGKLVPQDPNDEPASELLKRIAQEKGRLEKAGAIPRQKQVIRDASRLPEQLPSSWQPIALGQACNMVTSGSRGWAEFYADSGPRFIRAQNIRFGKLRLDDLACVNPPPNSEGSRTQVARGDLLVVITGAGVTNPARLDHDLGEAYVSQHVGLARPTDPRLSGWFLLCLMAPAGGRDELVECAYGAGRPGLNLDNIRSLSVPLPPLAEQHRIVIQVDELMALCDRLEASLTTGEDTRRRLLDALLAEALEPVEGDIEQAA
jgi:type I restriction enzyme S subunit